MSYTQIEKKKLCVNQRIFHINRFEYIDSGMIKIKSMYNFRELLIEQYTKVGKHYTET